MSFAGLKSLRCPRCGGSADAPTWLDQARTRQFESEGVPVACPRCQVELHLHIAPERASVGSLSDSRPRMFRPEASVEQPGLEVRHRPEGVRVRFEQREWWFEIA